LPENAGLTGKRYDRVLEDIRKMLTDLTPSVLGGVVNQLRFGLVEPTGF
jgi:hypothetical protein